MLADDAVLFREGTARVLIEAGFEVAGQAGNAAELLDLIRRDPPAVAIIDIRMPPAHSAEGLEAAVEIRRMSSDVGLLLLSQHVETHHAMRLMTEFEGSVGYLLKDRVSDLATFASDVRRIANGDCVIDPELVARLVDKKREGDPLADLTERERRVLALMAQGRSNSAMSKELYLSGKTIEAHVRSIFMKLNLTLDAGDHRRVLAVLDSCAPDRGTRTGTRARRRGPSLAGGVELYIICVIGRTSQRPTRAGPRRARRRSRLR